MKGQVTIRIADYYGHTELYPFMAKEMFAALESAFLAGDEFAVVESGQLEHLVNEFKTAHHYETNE